LFFGVQKMKRPDWFEKLQPYAEPDAFKSSVYVLTSIVPYLFLLIIMFILLNRGYPYRIVLLLSIPAIGFYVRTFMILHDCSHSSFVKSKILSFFLGHFCGVLTMTPFFDWQRNHGIHHASVSNLDKRGTGDVWTMTLEEYCMSNLLVKMQYRFFRNPFFLFGIAPTLLFCVMYRFPQKSTRRKDYFSIVITDLILAMIVITAYKTIGLEKYLAVQLPITVVATSIGMWLFYIQHQFETVYWAHTDKWDLVDAAMNGSSFYKLPEILRWFSGNIGFHNIHHLKPRIPCYNLKTSYDNLPDLHYTIPITLVSGFRSMRLHLWDEESLKLIRFKEAVEKWRQHGGIES
jgi:acyl-lipid omega-6 desaturase (Delta-12 desaturase)